MFTMIIFFFLPETIAGYVVKRDVTNIYTRNNTHDMNCY